MRNYAQWIAAIGVVAVMFYLVVFARPIPEYPEMTPEDKAKLEEIQREAEMIRDELRDLNRLQQLQREGKLWSA